MSFSNWERRPSRCWGGMAIAISQALSQLLRDNRWKRFGSEGLSRGWKCHLWLRWKQWEHYTNVRNILFILTLRLLMSWTTLSLLTTIHSSSEICCNRPRRQLKKAAHLVPKIDQSVGKSLLRRCDRLQHFLSLIHYPVFCDGYFSRGGRRHVFTFWGPHSVLCNTSWGMQSRKASGGQCKFANLSDFAESSLILSPLVWRPWGYQGASGHS